MSERRKCGKRRRETILWRKKKRKRGKTALLSRFFRWSSRSLPLTSLWVSTTSFFSPSHPFPPPFLFLLNQNRAPCFYALAFANSGRSGLKFRDTSLLWEVPLPPRTLATTPSLLPIECNHRVQKRFPEEQRMSKVGALTAGLEKRGWRFARSRVWSLKLDFKENRIPLRVFILNLKEEINKRVNILPLTKGWELKKELTEQRFDWEEVIGNREANVQMIWKRKNVYHQYSVLFAEIESNHQLAFQKRLKV